MNPSIDSVSADVTGAGGDGGDAKGNEDAPASSARSNMSSKSSSSIQRRMSPPAPPPASPPPDDASHHNSTNNPLSSRGIDGVGGVETAAKQGGQPDTPELCLSRKLRADQSLCHGVSSVSSAPRSNSTHQRGIRDGTTAANAVNEGERRQRSTTQSETSTNRSMTPEERLSMKLRNDQSLRMSSHSMLEASAPNRSSLSGDDGLSGGRGGRESGVGQLQEDNGPTLTPDERLARKLRSSTMPSSLDEVGSAQMAEAAGLASQSGMATLEDECHQCNALQTEGGDMEHRPFSSATNASDDRGAENVDVMRDSSFPSRTALTATNIVEDAAVSSQHVIPMNGTECEGAVPVRPTLTTMDDNIDPERVDGSRISAVVERSSAAAATEQERPSSLVSSLYPHQRRHRSSATDSATDDSQNYSALPLAEVSTVYSAQNEENEYIQGNRDGDREQNNSSRSLSSGNISIPTNSRSSSGSDVVTDAEAVPAYKPEEVQDATVVTTSKMCCIVVHTKRFRFLLATVATAIIIAIVVGAVVATRRIETHLEDQSHVKTAITQDNIQIAVDSWVIDPVSTEQQFGHIRDWDTSQITSMETLFENKGTFNDDLSRWNVSAVERMNQMFRGCKLFDQDLSAWDVSSVRSMSGLFRGALSFNGDISSWDTGSVTSMNNMLRDTKSFTHTLCWDLSSISSMQQWDHGYGECDFNLKVCGAFCGSKGSFNASCVSEKLILTSKGCGF